MKLKYLGTAAYEGIPSPFCNCRVCKLSMAQGGRNLRSRTQALINDDLLLDFPPDTVWHFQRFPFDWNKIGAILITHSHSDHLYVEDVEIAAPAYSHDHTVFPFYAGKDGYEKLLAYCEKTQGGASAHLVTAFEKFQICNGNYTVLPLPADHKKNTSPLVYAIEGEGKRLLYAHDTGMLPEESIAALKREGRFDLLSLDCTGCVQTGWRDEHMSFDINLELIERFKKAGIADDNTKIVVNHFSHNGNATYDEMHRVAQPYGITVSYDGLELEF